ncbi:hypothetical protein [Treponema sp.]
MEGQPKAVAVVERSATKAMKRQRNPGTADGFSRNALIILFDFNKPVIS